MGARLRTRMTIVAALAAALLAPVAGARAAGTETDGVRVKPQSSVDLTVAVEDVGGAVAIGAEATHDDGAAVAVEVEAQGDAVLVAPVEGGGAETATAAALDGERGVVAVTASGDDASATQQVFLLADGDEVLAGTTGFSELELERVDARQARGEITPEEAEAQKAEVLGGASVTTASAPAEAPGGTITVGGTVQWADSGATLHPVRAAAVELYDIDGATEVLLGTTATADDGTYSFSVSNDDGPADPGQDVLVRVVASNPAFHVENEAGDTYALESAVVVDVADATALTVDIDASSPTTEDNHAAFSVHQAVVLATEYMAMIDTVPAAIPVVFPTAESTSLFNGTELHILQGDKFDWDVIHHEYGHYVASVHGIEDNPGGAHGFEQNLAEARGKSAGTRLAWGEGWPTYFGTTLQVETGSAALGVPGVGDLRYTDTDDAAIDYGIEGASDGGTGTGEDNELSVQRILWDIYDDADDANDRVSLGDDFVWDALTGSSPVNLSEAWLGMGGDEVSLQSVAIGCVFGDHRVAPVPTAPADAIGAPADAPTFEWDANGAGPSFRLNEFTVEFYDPGFSELIFASDPVNATTWTPTEDEWDAIVDEGGGFFNWVVRGKNTAAPETGPYTSCRRSMIDAKLDIAFVIDATGSMADDIANVRAAANTIMDTLVDSGRDFRVALTTYKDFPEEDPGSYPYLAHAAFTDDADVVRAALDGIFVSGGGDLPETVYSGLIHTMAGDGIGEWREDAARAIILMGDAPPLDPERVSGYTLADVLTAAAAGGFDLSKPAAKAAVAKALFGPPIVIHGIVVGFDSSALSTFSAISNGTGGEVFQAANAGEVVGAILDSLNALLTAPVASAGGPYTGRVGDTITFDGSASIGITDLIETYQWDVDGDGTYDLTGPTPTATHTYTAPYTGVVGLRVTDAGGRIGVSSAPVTITGGGAGGGGGGLQSTETFATGAVGAGGALATLGIPTPTNPIVTSVTKTDAGDVTIQEDGDGFEAPDGYTGLPVGSTVTTDGAVQLEFRLHRSLLPAGEDGRTVAVFRDGEVVPRCDVAGTLGPSPCVTAAFDDEDGNVVVHVLTDRNSRWDFATTEHASTGASCAGLLGTHFADVGAADVHRDAIGCITELRVASGVSATAFDPSGAITRAQIAAFVDRLLARTVRPAGGNEVDDAFDDDDGSIHEAAINRLAAAGIVSGRDDRTFDPGAAVTRAEIASLLARAYNHVTGRSVDDAPDAFGDDDGSVHEAAIDAGALLGLVAGTGDGAFDPDGDASRAQVATLVARLLSRLAVERQLA